MEEVVPRVGQKAFVKQEGWDRLISEGHLPEGWKPKSPGPWVVTDLHRSGDYALLSFPFAWLKFSELELVEEAPVRKCEKCDSPAAEGDALCRSCRTLEEIKEQKRADE